jgi:hypothetical protein
MTNASRKPVARKIAAAPAPRRPRRERRAAAARQPVLHLVMPGLEIAQAVPRPGETVTAFLRPTGWGRRDRVYGWQFGKGCRPSLRSTASRADGRHGIGAWRRKGALLSGPRRGLVVDAKLAASSLSLPGRHGFTANVLAREQEDSLTRQSGPLCASSRSASCCWKRYPPRQRRPAEQTWPNSSGCIRRIFANVPQR